jgi:hypothetical protein
MPDVHPTEADSIEADEVRLLCTEFYTNILTLAGTHELPAATIMTAATLTSLHLFLSAVREGHEVSGLAKLVYHLVEGINEHRPGAIPEIPTKPRKKVVRH